jgi:hypothetical protein
MTLASASAYDDSLVRRVQRIEAALTALHRLHECELSDRCAWCAMMRELAGD